MKPTDPITSTDQNTKRTLLPHHYKQLQDSGLTDETIEKSGIYSIVDGEEARELLNWQKDGPTPPVPGMAFSYPGTDYKRHKPDNPRVIEGPMAAEFRKLQAQQHDHDYRKLVLEEDDSKTVKYESPKGYPSRLYRADLLWGGLKPGSPLWLVEGEKKALAACQCGLMAIGAPGVWSFGDAQARRNSKEAGEDLRVLHPDLTAIDLKGREVIICFDSDIDTKLDVLKAAVCLAQMLLRVEADPHIAYIPSNGPNKVGLDDFLAANPAEKEPLAEVENSVRPFGASSLLEYIVDKWDDWNKKTQEQEIRRAVQLVQLTFKNKSDFKDWIHQAQRALKVPASLLNKFKLPDERKEKGVRQWFQNWVIKNEISYSYASGCIKMRGKIVRSDELMSMLALDSLEAGGGIQRTNLEDAFRLWQRKQDEHYVANIKNVIAYAGPQDTNQAENLIKAMTGKADPLEIAVVLHLIWQVKRKMWGLKVVQHLMPIICGLQGCGKSEALRKLLEPIIELCDFAADLSCLGDERQNFRLARSYVFIFDEMAKAKKVDIDSLKNRITSPSVSWRILGKNQSATGPNVATFIGASNNDLQDLVYDPGGVRRFYQLNCQNPMDWGAINSLDSLALWKSVDENAASPLVDNKVLMDELKRRQEGMRVKDAVEQWLDECCDIGGDNWTRSNECFSSFSNWQKYLGQPRWYVQSFGRRLGKLVKSKVSNGTRYNLALNGNEGRSYHKINAEELIDKMPDPSKPSGIPPRQTTGFLQ